MKLGKTRVLLPAMAATFLFASQAVAQLPPAPTVTATVNGAMVSLQWTAVPGATAYDIVVTGAYTGTVSVPASVTQFQASAPDGTYGIQIRGTLGTVLGPLSDLVTFTVGASAPPPGPCSVPEAPTVTATTAGTSVTVSWSAVAGALGYRVEFSRTPGGTDLVQSVGATQVALQQTVPIGGTFYVRVVAGNACGAAPSTEVSFTIDIPPPPRTPDPVRGAPGVDCSSRNDCLLIPPAYGRDVVMALGAAYPAEARMARPSECRGGNNLFLFRVLRELRKRDTRWGLNYKRGNYPILSEDIIVWNGSARPDEGESHIHLFDVVGGACFAALPRWGDASRVTWGNRGASYCGTEWCARWTLAPYLAAGYPEFPQ